MSDIFREVDEDVRSDKLAEFWSKYSIVVLGLAVAIVIATAIFTYLEPPEAGPGRNRRRGLSRRRRPCRRANSPRPPPRLSPISPRRRQRAIRFWRGMRAAEETGLSDPAAAVTAFDLLAVDPAVDPLWRDLARLRAGMLRVDSADKAEVEQRFAPLLNGSYRFTAREFMGLAALKRGDFEEAGKLFDQIVVDPNAPANLRQRVQGFLSLVRGGGKFTPAPA